MLDKQFADLRMDQTRLPRDATAVTATQSQALKDGEVLADDGASYSTVQAAQDAASSWIRLPPGTFNEAVTVDTPGLSVVGSGYDTLIDSSSDTISVTASDVTILNLSASTSDSSSYAVYLNGANATACNISIVGIVGRGIGSGGVADDALIRDCLISQVDSTAILTSGERAVVVANVIDSCVNGVNSHAVNISGDDSIAASNILVDSPVNATETYRSALSLADNDSIAYGNRVHNSNVNGIQPAGTDNIVVNNRVSDSGGSDINDIGTNTLLDSNVTGTAN